MDIFEEAKERMRGLARHLVLAYEAELDTLQEIQEQRKQRVQRTRRKAGRPQKNGKK